MNSQFLIQERLKQRLIEAKTKNPRTSVRSFARQMKLSPSTVSLVLLGKRKVSKTLALKMSDVLQFDKIERLKVVSSFDEAKASKSVLKRKNDSPHDRNKKISDTFKNSTLRLSEEQFDLLSEWYYFAILSLVQTHDFKLEAEWVAKRLSIQTTEAQQALDLLLKQKLLLIDASGKVRRSYELVRTADGKKSNSLKRANLQNLSLAKKALLALPVEERDLTWINLPVKIEDFDKMKLMIRKFQEEFLSTFVVKENANEVVRVCVQAFPVTKRSEFKK